MLPVGREEHLALRENGEHVVVVEAEALPSKAQGTFALKLWDRGGTRMVTLDGVAFPPLQVSASPRD